MKQDDWAFASSEHVPADLPLRMTVAAQQRRVTGMQRLISTVRAVAVSLLSILIIVRITFAGPTTLI